MISVVITKSAVNIPIISGDLYNGETDYLFSAVLGKPYTVDLTFQLFESTGGEGGDTPIPVTSVSASIPGYTGVTFQTLSADTVRVSGVPTVEFPSFYSFVLDQPNITEEFPTLDNQNVFNAIPTDFFAVYRWDPSVIFWQFLSGAYQFNVIGTTQSATANMSQYVYWDWDTALAAFISLVEAGDA